MPTCQMLLQAFCDSGLLHEAGMGGENQVTMLAEHARVATLRPGCLVFAPGPRTQVGLVIHRLQQQTHRRAKEDGGGELMDS
jgi:hypothetical protein